MLRRRLFRFLDKLLPILREQAAIQDDPQLFRTVPIWLVI
jgi:hypothetical protein